MKKFLILTCVLALSAFAPLAHAAGHEHGQPMKADESQQEVTKSASHNQKDMMSTMMEMMQKCKAMMSSEQFAPVSILAKKKELGLSEEQVNKLKEIDKESANKAKAVLKPEQVTKMEASSGHQKMMCPMMKMMNKDEGSKDMKEMKNNKKDHGTKTKDSANDSKSSVHEGMMKGK